MPTESEADELEQDGTFAHFVTGNDETASDFWERAAKIRDDLGDAAAHSAEWFEDPSRGHNPDRARDQRCQAAHLYAKATSDYLAASRMQENLGHAAAAATLKQKAVACAQKAVAWLESCLNLDFERGELGRRLMSDYEQLADFYKLLGQEDAAARAHHKSRLVRELRNRLAEEAKKALEQPK